MKDLIIAVVQIKRGMPFHFISIRLLRYIRIVISTNSKEEEKTRKTQFCICCCRCYTQYVFIKKNRLE